MGTLDAKVITELSGAWNAAQGLTTISTTVSTDLLGPQPGGLGLHERDDERRALLTLLAAEPPGHAVDEHDVTRDGAVHLRQLDELGQDPAGSGRRRRRGRGAGRVGVDHPLPRRYLR